MLPTFGEVARKACPMSRAEGSIRELIDRPVEAPPSVASAGSGHKLPVEALARPVTLPLLAAEVRGDLNDDGVVKS